MFAINNLQYKGTKPDIWFGVWKLTTSVRTNASGEWFMYEAAFAHFVDNVADVHRGEALYNAFASGEKQAEAPVVDEEEMEDAI